LRTRIVVLLVILLIVTILGGYGLHWSWTGFGSNGTVWDWLKLVVLPVTLALVPVWQSSHRKYRRVWIWAFSLFLVALAFLAAGGYGLHWRWTGFAGHPLWDWLEIFLVSFAVPLALALWRPPADDKLSHPVGGARPTPQPTQPSAASSQPSPASQPAFPDGRTQQAVITSGVWAVVSIQVWQLDLARVAA
jgi:hypothetical protein